MPSNICSDASVGVSKCNGYDNEEVSDALTRALEGLGGITAFVASGQTVLVKPNLLSAVSPELAVTTHPSVVRAVVRQALAAGAAKVMVGDSPATAQQTRALEVSGVGQAAVEAGAETVEFDEAVVREVRRGRQGRGVREVALAAAVAQADVVISVGKLKTHGFTVMTGAVKNLYGCIPGMMKAAYHMENPSPLQFGHLLVDIYEAVAPSLCVMDAVVAMEGHGPRNGKPTQVGLIMASANGFALDAFAARLIGLDPLKVPYLSAAHTRGLFDAARDGLLAQGQKVIPFDLGMGGGLFSRIPGPVMSLFRRHLAPRPDVQPKRCAACGECVRACPPGAVTCDGGRAKVDESSCIRCYCCQEVCPYDAIRLREGRLVRRLLRMIRR